MFGFLLLRAGESPRAWRERAVLRCGTGARDQQGVVEQAETRPDSRASRVTMPKVSPQSAKTKCAERHDADPFQYFGRFNGMQRSPGQTTNQKLDPRGDHEPMASPRRKRKYHVEKIRLRTLENATDGSREVPGPFTVKFFQRFIDALDCEGKTLSDLPKMLRAASHRTSPPASRASGGQEDDDPCRRRRAAQNSGARSAGGNCSTGRRTIDPTATKENEQDARSFPIITAERPRSMVISRQQRGFSDFTGERCRGCEEADRGPREVNPNEADQRDATVRHR